MRKVGDRVIYAPTDLVRYMESPYASWMDRFHLEHPDRAAPDPLSDDERLVLESGKRFERGYMDGLKAAGTDILSLEGSENHDATLDAMQTGKSLIYQGTLAGDRFAGRPDLLVRVERKSKLGDHAFTIRDTKLGRHPKPHYLVQLCVYADLLEPVLGHRPERFSIVLGNGREQWFRTDDFFFYYLTLKSAFLAAMDTFDPAAEPQPDLGGEFGQWAGRAEKWFRDRDHLRLVANITQLQIRRLEVAGITTVTALASLHEAGARATKIAGETLAKLKDQATVQHESKGKPLPEFRIIKPKSAAPRSGLALLPPPAKLDVFFDMEGYPYIDEGREYLFGAVTGEASGFQDWWAHDADEERKAFESFVDWAHDRWVKDPAAHIYHYAPYEASALKRLAGRHGTREEEVDDFLRNGVLVDLLMVVRSGLRIGSENYKLKTIEPLYWKGRDASVKTAGDSMVVYQRWLDSDEPSDWKNSGLLKRIRDYNEQDCDSLRWLAVWLRELQVGHKVPWVKPAEVAKREEEGKAKAAAKKAPGVTREDRQKLARAIISSLPSEKERDKAPDKWRIPEMLGYEIEYERREDKPAWWRLFDRAGAAERGEMDALADDLDCLGGLVLDKKRGPVPVDESTGFWYNFDPDQATKIEEGDKSLALVPGMTNPVRTVGVHALDREAGKVCVKIGDTLLSALPDRKPADPAALIPYGFIPAAVIEDSVYEAGQDWHQDQRIRPAVEHFLLRRPPRIRGHAGGAIVKPGEDPQEAAIRAAKDLDNSYLYVQGPPGSGKTTTAAHMIMGLVKTKAKIGVTANSHKVILNLLDKCLSEAKKVVQPIRVGKVGDNDMEDFHAKWPGVPVLKPNGGTAALAALEVIGGTAWYFARPELAGTFDYLFVDEASQIAVSRLIGTARSAKNLILVGDQMQLGQPTQGSHPRESGRSTLDYLLAGRAIIPPEMGILLNQTWRMHPDLCKFVSGAFYEDALHARKGTELNRIELSGGGKGRIQNGSGLVFVPVVHEGNTQSSPEEASVVRDVVAELVGRPYVSSRGSKKGTLTIDDILVVAPYNMQVDLLRRTIPKLRVGSVDKFQGQEAPVVIVSMCASQGEISARGIEFVLSKNRLNVAISRAECLSIVVGSPALAHSRPTSVTQVSLTNTFCRLVGA